MKSIAPKAKNANNPQPPPVIILPMLHKLTMCQAKNNENTNNQKHQLHQTTNIQSAPYYVHNEYHSQKIPSNRQETTLPMSQKSRKFKKNTRISHQKSL